jgi:class 3 adenylate cyclase
LILRAGTALFRGGAERLSLARWGGAVTETRKLAAILAGDVVGFTRLTGADEDRTLARLRALPAVVLRCHVGMSHDFTIVDR